MTTQPGSLVNNYGTDSLPLSILIHNLPTEWDTHSLQKKSCVFVHFGRSVNCDVTSWYHLGRVTKSYQLSSHESSDCIPLTSRN
jgi:hypothetical protein